MALSWWITVNIFKDEEEKEEEEEPLSPDWASNFIKHVHMWDEY